MGKFYDRQGKPINGDEWLYLSRDYEEVVLSRDVLDNVVVSTVWFGFDKAQSHLNEDPALFETIVYAADGSDLLPAIAVFDGAGYGSEEDAFDGHEEIVALCEAYLARTTKNEQS